jgi:hypothetical protein
VPSAGLRLVRRIRDFPRLLGIPLRAPAGRPLPWLPSPVVGHPAWDGYLTQRAQLIADRVNQLGSLTAAYREAYQLTHLPDGHLGDLPPEGTTRRDAYHAAHRDLTAHNDDQAAPSDRGVPPENVGIGRTFDLTAADHDRALRRPPARPDGPTRSAPPPPPGARRPHRQEGPRVTPP